MKLYNSIGPNPRAVRIFLAEKGLEVETVTLDLMGGENRREEHVARNQPTLEAQLRHLEQVMSEAQEALESGEEPGTPSGGGREEEEK